MFREYPPPGHFAGKATIVTLWKRKTVVLSWCLLFLSVKAVPQPTIPTGTWRAHLSYNNIQLVQITAENIFAAGTSGIIVYNLAEQSLRTYNKLNMLSGTGISALGYDEPRKQLLVGYENGVLDIIGEKEMVSFVRLRDAAVTTSKQLNGIAVHENLAYLSTAYGIVTFDLRQRQIKETWRDLGPAGEQLAVYQCAFLNDSIFLASANGVLIGSLNDNLLDFNNWTRFTTDLSGPIGAITTFNNKVYAAGAAGFYRFTGNGWSREPYLQDEHIGSLSASNENLFIVSGETALSIDVSGNVSPIADPAITSPAVVKQDARGSLWVGDRTRGLVSNAGGAFSSYLPNGPSRNTVRKITHHDGSILAVSGGFNAAGQPLNTPGELNVFEDGSWHTTVLPASDLTDIAFGNDKMFVASFGSGVLVTSRSGEVSFYDETNSPLVNNVGGPRVSALEESARGLWVANYGGDASLHLLKDDGTWESFAFAYPNADAPTQLAVDGKGNVWIALNPESDGRLLVFDPETHQEYFKTATAGAGGLPHERVRCLAVDRDGLVWIGTSSGVAWFPSAAEDAIKPIYENRFLLRNEKITAIAVDGGNRKWIGTENGAWLFSPTGEALVYHFTTENSPLLSDAINDIAIHPRTGEVFFATRLGIVSYRSDATEAESDFGKVRIFPNPVRPGFSGTVAIDGLARDADIRITDVGGKLVWQTRANGGTASWNVRDLHGKRVSTGIYLVFATKQDGSDGVVGKVAVIGD